jgi:tetratricopeptide (TPR) repeat protein
MHQHSSKRRSFRAPDPARLDRHMPFIEVLGRVRPRTPRWYRCRAGLMVLELLDRVWWTWRTNTEVGMHRRLAIRRAIAVVRPKATRVVLDELLHLAAPGADPQPEALTVLMRYAERLQYESEFRLASHVYSMVIDYAAHIGHVELLVEAYRHHGTCMRERGNAGAAMVSYATGLSLAARHRDKKAQIRIAIAQSNLYWSVDRAEEARKLLDPVLRRARRLADPELLMRAAHERGIVSNKLGNDTEALLFFAEAFQNCADPKHQSRLLNDIAVSLMELGFLTEAGDTWLVSYLVTKGDSYAKWAAGINLLRLARVREDETAFDQYREALEPAPMAAKLLVHYWREVADGLAKFRRTREATSAYNRVATLAERHGYKKQAEEAELALQGNPIVEPPPPTPPVNLPTVAEDLLAKVRALRSLPNLLGRAWGGDASATSVAPLRATLKRGRRPRSSVA